MARSRNKNCQAVRGNYIEKHMKIHSPTLFKKSHKNGCHMNSKKSDLKLT